MSPSNPLFTGGELEKMLAISKSRYLIAHPINLDIALQAAEKSGIPKSNIWSICKDPKNRVPYWKDAIITGKKEEAGPIKLTVEESKTSMAYICFSSGTTGK